MPIDNQALVERLRHLAVHDPDADVTPYKEAADTIERLTHIEAETIERAERAEAALRTALAKSVAMRRQASQPKRTKRRLLGGIDLTKEQQS